MKKLRAVRQMLEEGELDQALSRLRGGEGAAARGRAEAVLDGLGAGEPKPEAEDREPQVQVTWQEPDQAPPRKRRLRHWPL